MWWYSLVRNTYIIVVVGVLTLTPGIISSPCQTGQAPVTLSGVEEYLPRDKTQTKPNWSRPTRMHRI